MMNLVSQTKETWKQSYVFKYIHSDKKMYYEKSPRSLSNVKFYDSSLNTVAYFIHLGATTQSTAKQK